MNDHGTNSAKWHDEPPGLSDIVAVVRELRLITGSSFRHVLQLGHEAHFKVGIFVNLETHNIRVLFGDYDRTDHESLKFNRLNGERFYGAEITVSQKTLNTCGVVSRNGGVDAVPPEIKKYTNDAMHAFFNRK